MFKGGLHHHNRLHSHLVRLVCLLHGHRTGLGSHRHHPIGLLGLSIDHCRLLHFLVVYRRRLLANYPGWLTVYRGYHRLGLHSLHPDPCLCGLPLRGMSDRADYHENADATAPAEYCEKDKKCSLALFLRPTFIIYATQALVVVRRRFHFNSHVGSV